MSAIPPTYPITRRELIRRGAAFGAAAAVAPLAGWLPAPRSFAFAYFSDTHLALDRNVVECRAGLAEIAERVRPAFAVNGGDVTDYGWPGEYDNYARVLAGWDFPVHHIPGNHDVRWAPRGLQIFRERVGAAFRSFDHGGCHFALLDSTVPLSHYGHFESAQLRWLERDLRRVGREVPVFIFTHHWVGRAPVMADNEDPLRRVLEPFNVKMVFTGHGHSDLDWVWDGMPCTMNKGLYQGSWQRAEVDRERGEFRLARRTIRVAEPATVATVPLAAPREKRMVWSLGAALVAAGEPLIVRAPEATERRWNAGAWAPLPLAGRLPTDDLDAGSNRLHLRAGPTGATRALEVRVRRPDAALRPRWERRLSGGVMSHLALHDGTLYVSAMDGAVYALAAADGRVRWRAETGDYCHSSPVLHGSRLLVGSADGHAYAWDARSGRPLWKHRTDGPVYASAAVAKGVAVFASGDGRVYGLDAATGRPRWTWSLPPGNSAFAQSPAATDGERFFIGAWDRHVYALDAATGALVWKALGTERSFAYSPAIGGPAVGGGTVYVPANDNQLHAWDAASGTRRWVATTPGDKFGYSSPLLVGDRIYIGCLGDRGEVRCLSAADGREVWTAATGRTIYDSSPAHADGRIAIGSVDGTLSLLRAADGALLDQHRLPTGHLLASPAMGDGMVFAASLSDMVVGFDVG